MPPRPGADTPGRFRRAPKAQTSRARRAFRSRGPGSKLLAALGDAARLSTVRPGDLDSAFSEHPSGLYDHATMRALFDALATAYRGPLYAVAEVGKGDHRATGRGLLHFHIIHHKNDGPTRDARPSERCKPLHDPAGLYRYLSKPPERYSLEAALDLAAARVTSPTGRAPRTRRHYLSADRLRWAADRSSARPQCTNDLTLSNDPKTEPLRAPLSPSTGAPARERPTLRRAAPAGPPTPTVTTWTHKLGGADDTTRAAAAADLEAIRARDFSPFDGAPPAPPRRGESYASETPARAARPGRSGAAAEPRWDRDRRPLPGGKRAHRAPTVRRPPHTGSRAVFRLSGALADTARAPESIPGHRRPITAAPVRLGRPRARAPPPPHSGEHEPDD